MLYLKTSKVYSTGRRTSEGFVVFKGSKVSEKSTRSCPGTINNLREQFEEKIDINSVLTDDILFTSPSAAAGFVTYGSSNGLIAWTTEDGITLKEYENDKID